MIRRITNLNWCPVLVFLLVSSPLIAQAERLPVKTYTSADGLGSGFLNDVMRDSRGFMWFCTRDGLSRFDGAGFVTYRIGNREAPPGIEGITETRDGSYWITTTGGLYRFKRDAISQPTTGNRPTLNAEFIGPFRGEVI
jgi:ligand-binding sensor domain-containing protein